MSALVPRMSEASRPELELAFAAACDLWPALTHDGARLAFPLPGRYVAAGGFFDWLFYWDSYFIVLGLMSSGSEALAGELVDGLLAEVAAFGFVPNFNAPDCVGRSRSQPPLLTSMIRELTRTRGLEWLESASSLAAREYHGYWCAPPHQTPFGLSRYADNGGVCPTVPDTPHFRAMAESGWDNTPRFRDDATDVVPIDLNAQLYRYERDLAAFSRELGRGADARDWDRRADERRALIDQWLWDDRAGHYRDLSLSRGTPLEGVPRSLALYVPLWAGVASARQASLCRAQLGVFEREHGLASCEPGWADGTEHNYPVGWAYSHWFAVEGLRRYGYLHDGMRVARKWVSLIAKRYAATGAFFERYDVVEPERLVEGRYETQTGFGWTNGVYVALLARVLDGDRAAGGD
jgi:alpha,alpha-trehalase